MWSSPLDAIVTTLSQGGCLQVNSASQPTALSWEAACRLRLRPDPCIRPWACV